MDSLPAAATPSPQPGASTLSNPLKLAQSTGLGSGAAAELGPADAVPATSIETAGLSSTENAVSNAVDEVTAHAPVDATFATRDMNDAAHDLPVETASTANPGAGAEPSATPNPPSAPAETLSATIATAATTAPSTADAKPMATFDLSLRPTLSVPVDVTIDFSKKASAATVKSAGATQVWSYPRLAPVPVPSLPRLIPGLRAARSAGNGRSKFNPQIIVARKPKSSVAALNELLAQQAQARRQKERALEAELRRQRSGT